MRIYNNRTTVERPVHRRRAVESYYRHRVSSSGKSDERLRPVDFHLLSVNSGADSHHNALVIPLWDAGNAVGDGEEISLPVLPHGYDPPVLLGVEELWVEIDIDAARDLIRSEVKVVDGF